MSEVRERADLLSTGEVSRLLGVSRQHVVDLCERGELTFNWVGAHRRVHRTDVEVLLAPHLTRDQERSLWLHNAVAGRLVLDPKLTLDQAWVNLEILELKHPGGMAARWIARWREILDRGIDAVLETLTSRSALAVDLRQNSPFAGVLSADDRQRALAAFRAHWMREHAA